MNPQTKKGNKLLTEETWKPIPTWEGIYEASTQGRIKSLARTVQRGTKPMKIKQDAA